MSRTIRRRKISPREKLSLEALSVQATPNPTRALRKLYSDSNVEWSAPKWFRTFYNRRLRRKHKSEMYYGKELTLFVHDVKYDYF
jgi:hypothetical protein